MKNFTLILLFLLIPFIVYSSDAESHFKAKHKSTQKYYPVEHTIGQTVNSDSTEANSVVAEIMKGPYTMDLAEKYLDPSVKQVVVNVYVSKLQDIIPSDNYFMSVPHTNGDGSSSIRVLCHSKILDIAVLEGKVIALDVTEI